MSLNDFIRLHLDLINLNLNKKKTRDCLNKYCNKNAVFNFPKYKELKFGKFIYCKLHKLPNMINVKSKKCIYLTILFSKMTVLNLISLLKKFSIFKLSLFFINILKLEPLNNLLNPIIPHIEWQFLNL